MKLIGKIMADVEKTENREQAKELTKDVGKKLVDEEMDQVVGGANTPVEPNSFFWKK